MVESSESEIELEFSSDKGTIDALEKLFRSFDDTSVSRSKTAHPGLLALDLNDIATIVAIAKTMMFDDAILPSIFSLLNEKKPHRVSIVWPGGEFIYEGDKPLSLDDLKSKMGG